MSIENMKPIPTTIDEIKPGDIFIVQFPDGRFEHWMASSDGAREELRVKMLITPLFGDFTTKGIGYLQNQPGLKYWKAEVGLQTILRMYTLLLQASYKDIKQPETLLDHSEIRETLKEELPKPQMPPEKKKPLMTEYREIDNVLCSNKEYRTLVLPHKSHVNLYDIEKSNQLMAKWFRWVDQNFPITPAMNRTNPPALVCIPPDAEMFSFHKGYGVEYGDFDRYEKVEGFPCVAYEGYIKGIAIDNHSANTMFAYVCAFNPGIEDCYYRLDDLIVIYKNDHESLKEQDWQIKVGTCSYREYTDHAYSVKGIKGYHCTKGSNQIDTIGKNYPVRIKNLFLAVQYDGPTNVLVPKRTIQTFAEVETIMNGKFSAKTFVVRFDELKTMTKSEKDEYQLESQKEESKHTMRKINHLINKGFIINPETDDVVILPEGKMMYVKLFTDDLKETPTRSYTVKILRVLDRKVRLGILGEPKYYYCKTINLAREIKCHVDPENLISNHETKDGIEYHIRKNSKLYNYDANKGIMEYQMKTDPAKTFKCEILEYKMTRISDTFDAFVRVKIDGIGRYWTKFDFLEEYAPTQSEVLNKWESWFCQTRVDGVPIDVCNDYVIPIPKGSGMYDCKSVADDGSFKYEMVEIHKISDFIAARLLKRKIIGGQCYGWCIDIDNEFINTPVWFNLSEIAKQYEPIHDITHIMDKVFKFKSDHPLIYLANPSKARFITSDSLTGVCSALAEILVMSTCIGTTAYQTDKLEVFCQVTSKSFTNPDISEKYWFKLSDLKEI
jgi:hypothetical protein